MDTCKVCSACNEEKPLEDSSHRRGQCKKCLQERSRAYREKNPEKGVEKLAESGPKIILRRIERNKKGITGETEKEC